MVHHPSFFIEDATVTLRMRGFTVKAATEDQARLEAAELVQRMGYVDSWEVSLEEAGK